MKKTLSILLAIVMVFALCATASAEGSYTVGICQLVQHAALDAATQGFIDALTEELGDAVTFDNHWIWKTSTVLWAAMFRALPTWLRSISRLLW